MGNSTSYLHELFKSSSILSVSQRNNSDCIYICVMAGREVPELWDVGSITPLFNQTIVEGPHAANISFRLPVEWHQLPTNLSHISPSGMSSMLTSRVHSTAHASPTAVDEAAASTAKVTTAQPLTTAPQPTTVTPQSYTTAETPETTQQPTAPSMTARAVTAQRETTPTVASSQSGTREEKTTLAPITTLKQRTTTAAAPTAAAPTTAAPRLPTTPGRASTFSPAVSLIRTPASTSTAAPHTTSTVHPTRLPPVRATAGPTVPRRTTGPLVRTTTPSKPTEKPALTTSDEEEKSELPSPGCVLEPGQRKRPDCGSLARSLSRYCDDSHLWYEKHTSEVCRRVRRVSFSRSKWTARDIDLPGSAARDSLCSKTNTCSSKEFGRPGANCIFY
ncbi:uncharacterized protein LOC102799368 [Neolamprologus brichardi]|uniref:uncharacterized protein LOC102799368 n=1 Tax=Neolamprologus brichardi TaxID=32507 RepID=UPI001643A336|nr:uncharacterized protein LOC102799368 [Neolamprologus brichardi]